MASQFVKSTDTSYFVGFEDLFESSMKTPSYTICNGWFQNLVDRILGVFKFILQI